MSYRITILLPKIAVYANVSAVAIVTAQSGLPFS